MMLQTKILIPNRAKKIMPVYSIVVSFFLLTFQNCSHGEGEGFAIVRNHRAVASVIVPDQMNPLQEIAVTDFVRTIYKSTGAELPVINEKEAGTLPLNSSRIVIGPSKLTAGLGFSGSDLKPEEFQITTSGNTLIILARDIVHSERPKNIWSELESENSRVTQWALGYLLDRYVGVRWLWPGDLGTHIPEKRSIILPELDLRFQTPYVRRCFNVIEGNPENLLWLNYHTFAGERKDYHFQHSFRATTDNGDWYSEFRDTHPEYLARDPEGNPGYVYNRKTFYKLCISNPGVTDEIIHRWVEAGKPDFWDVTPNDGNGFCSCDQCMELDRKYGDVAYTREEVWNRPDHVFLTDRYVWFWNQLIHKMRSLNPDVKIGIYLYSAYRNPPKKLKVAEGIIGEMVHGFDFSFWKAWQEAGIQEIGLRPNWLYMGASGPHLPLTTMGKYVEQARENGMILINMDCFHEYWATQGPYYYLLGRLVARPDLHTPEIIEEYCDAFGKAAPAIREYLDYWEKYHLKVAYNIPAGGKLSQDSSGLYETICRTHFGEALHPLRGHWITQPYIYTPEIMEGAMSILDRAGELAKTNTSRRRIDFLRDGLEMVEKSKTYMVAYNQKDEPGKQVAARELEHFGEAMRIKHGYWNSKDLFFLKYWGLMGKERDTSGM